MFQSFSTHSHTSSIRTVASNGKFVASGGADDRICLYNLEKRQAIDDLYIHDGTINSLEFTPCGNYLVSGGSDGKMSFVKSSNWKVDKVFEKAHKGSSVNFISVHPSGKLALSIGSDLILRTWNLINGRQAFATSLKNKAFGTTVDFVQWSPSGDYFLVAGKDTIEVWSTEQAEVIATKKSEARPTAVSWLSDSDILVGMDNGKLLFFNWEDEEEEATLCEIYDNRVKAMKYLDGYLVTASSNGELNIWKVILEDKVEIDMICGVNIGCRLICLDIIDLAKAGLVSEVKDEDQEELKRTQVKQLFKTSGAVVVEIDDDEEAPTPSKNKSNLNKRKLETPKAKSTPQTSQAKSTPQTSNKKKSKRASVRLSNGFVEEDC